MEQVTIYSDSGSVARLATEFLTDDCGTSMCLVFLSVLHRFLPMGYHEKQANSRDASERFNAAGDEDIIGSAAGRLKRPLSLDVRIF